MNPLDDLRKKIDEIDSQLIDLFNTRARIAIEVGEIKKKQGKPIYAPDREDVLLRSLMEKNDGPLSDDHLRAIFIEILSASRAVEEVLKIACEADGYEASRERFGASSHYLIKSSLHDVVESVSSGKANLGILPFTNSEGRICEEAIPFLLSSSHTICTQLWRGSQQRFLAIGSISPPPSGNDQTLIWLTFPSRQDPEKFFSKEFQEQIIHAHSLSGDALFARENHHILLEWNGHRSDNAFQSTLPLLKEVCQDVQILGSFPKGNFGI